jgi:hypothetical protein
VNDMPPTSGGKSVSVADAKRSAEEECGRDPRVLSGLPPARAVSEGKGPSEVWVAPGPWMRARREDFGRWRKL